LRTRRFAVAVASDLHVGSIYCRTKAIRDFIDTAYERGIRNVLMPGDNLDGEYENHGRYEQTHVGVTKQTRAFRSVLPQRKGLRYDAILGNHEHTFHESSGLDVADYINTQFRAAGRKDLTVHGAREAFLRVHGIDICLWHPRGSFSQLAMRKQLRGLAPGLAPRFMFTGHWHVFDRVREGRCEAFACRSFQGGGGDFGNSLPGATTVGGLIVSWAVDGHGEPHSIHVECHDYPEPVADPVVEITA